jgi:hypothetical protein
VKYHSNTKHLSRSNSTHLTGIARGESSKIITDARQKADEEHKVAGTTRPGFVDVTYKAERFRVYDNYMTDEEAGAYRIRNFPNLITAQ